MDNEVVEILEPKKKKKTIKERQLNRIKRMVPEVDEIEIKSLLDDPLENREELRLSVVENGKDPKEVFNNPIFSKRLIKYINEFKDESVESINETIEEAKEQINEAVDEILEDKKVELLESILNKFELLVEMMGSKIEDLDKIKDKYDDMLEDIENRVVDKTPLVKEVVKEEYKIPNVSEGLLRMLKRV
jgi:predicted component of type VI protein secretion system